MIRRLVGVLVVVIGVFFAWLVPGGRPNAEPGGGRALGAAQRRRA